jgi:hypothetical protein
MATRNQVVVALVLALAAFGPACGDDNDDEAPPDSGGSFVRRDGGDEDEDSGNDEEVDGGAGDAGEEDTLTASESEAKAKGWVVGCYKKPKTSDELLNSCASGWREFDKTWYPADWKEGETPALP